MEKLLHERLRKWVAEANSEGDTPIHVILNELAGKATSLNYVDRFKRQETAFYAIADEIERDYIPRTDYTQAIAELRMNHNPAGIIGYAAAADMPFDEGQSITEWLDKWFIKRPLFEDGEPVQDSDMEEIGALATCCVYLDGSWKFNPDKYEDESNPKPWDWQKGTKDERIKRPAPKVLDADGVEINVGDTVWFCREDAGAWVVEDVYKTLGGDWRLSVGKEGNASCMGVPPNDVTHQKPVFDADGVRICVGDAVWVKSTGYAPWGVRGVVADIIHGRPYVDFDNGHVNTCCEGDWLTHKEPDSFEKLLADMNDIVKPTEAAHGEHIKRLAALIGRGA